MELPYNTRYSKELTVLGQEAAPTQMIADWPTKRAWVDYAFAEMRKAGYEVSSAYTVVKDKTKTQFIYRDALWRGADMFGTVVASFGYVNGVHVQNVDTWEQYVGMLDRGELPIGRALPVTERQRLIREMVLQLKTGRIERDYFRGKFGVDVTDEFRDSYRKLEGEGWLKLNPTGVELTPAGLMQIDRHLPTFFESQYQTTRYA